RSPPPITRFPYTTLFRSCVVPLQELDQLRRHVAQVLALRVLERVGVLLDVAPEPRREREMAVRDVGPVHGLADRHRVEPEDWDQDRKSTRLNSSHVKISY